MSPYLVPGLLVAAGAAAVGYALFGKPQAKHATTSMRSPLGIPSLLPQAAMLANADTRAAMLQASTHGTWSSMNDSVSGDPVMARYRARRIAMGCHLGR